MVYFKFFNKNTQKYSFLKLIFIYVVILYIHHITSKHMSTIDIHNRILRHDNHHIDYFLDVKSNELYFRFRHVCDILVKKYFTKQIYLKDNLRKYCVKYKYISTVENNKLFDDNSSFINIDNIHVLIKKIPRLHKNCKATNWLLTEVFPKFEKYKISNNQTNTLKSTIETKIENITDLINLGKK